MSIRCIALLMICTAVTACSADTKDLRLVPFPKQVTAETGLFGVRPTMALTFSETPLAHQAAGDLQQELKRVADCACRTDFAGDRPGLPPYWLFLRISGMMPAEAKALLAAATRNSEGYRLIVRPAYAAVGARDASGLVWGTQTLIQLIRANMQGHSIPCVTIDDWPVLRYRGFQDDITRGPSPTLDTLELETRMAALTKQNYQTYYIEHQYAFNKYPDIGPKDGSLLPKELKSLVAYAQARGVDIIGSQQSFGHWATILSNPKYARLGETSWVLNPQLKETYQMLDDMYSEQAPLTSSPFFNVNCDETVGLGTRSNHDLVKQIGVGKLYADHITRLHDMLRDKYHKRMMMWGDIILRHPENLKDIPKDTMMLSWDYRDRVSYDDHVVPFEKAGFDYLVCPCTTCWSVLPDFGFAIDNIQRFISDGVKHGTKGLLNTTWDDDAESFFGYYWHGIAWGAECAWNASATSIADFNNRIGPVLFGDKDNHFGRAINILIKTHKSGIDITDRRFWRTASLPAPADRDKAAKDAKALLDVADPALQEFILARKAAQVNADQLDYVVFGAERMKCIATRMLSLLDAADRYAKAVAAPGSADALLKQAIQDVQSIRDEHARLKARYKELWLREEKPYSLDWTLKKFDNLIAGYDKTLSGLKSAQTALAEKRPLPKASDIGL